MCRGKGRALVPLQSCDYSSKLIIQKAMTQLIAIFWWGGGGGG